MQKPADQEIFFRHDLQGLRAIAILLVVFAHAGLSFFPGGFIGVDVFFVLSGFLITGLLLREFNQKGRIELSRFYSRRLKRLLPSLLLMLSVSFIAAIVLLSGVEARSQLASSPFAVTWTSNLYFAFNVIDYFDELSSQDLFLHTWSLGVEEQFYLIWPAFLLILFKVVGLRRESPQTTSGPMMAGFMVVFITSFMLSLYWTKHMPQAAFYLMPARIWQFALGAMVCLFFQDQASGSKALAPRFSNIFTYCVLVAGLILVIASALFLTPDLAYPGLWALGPSLGAALVIAAGHTMPQGKDHPLAHPLLLWLGDRSYSLYLWHWPIFMIGFSLGYREQLLPTLSMAFLSLLAASLSYRFIELPFWKGRWSHSTPRHIILISLLVMSAVVFAMYHGLRQLPKPDNTQDLSNHWRMDVPEIYRMPCDAWYAHSRVEPCVFGPETAQKTVVVLGDSIGAQWFSMVPAIFSTPSWRIIVLTKSSCGIVDEDWYYPRLKRIFKICTDWRNAVLDELDALKPDVLIMGNSATYNFSETQWVEGSRRIFKRVSNAANTVIVIPGTPTLHVDGPSCVSRNLSPDGAIDRRSCESKNRLQTVDLVTTYLDRAMQRFPNIHLLNLNDLVCPGGICNAITETGVVVFRDKNHLTDTFVRMQVPIIHERIKQVYEDSALSGTDEK